MALQSSPLWSMGESREVSALPVELGGSNMDLSTLSAAMPAEFTSPTSRGAATIDSYVVIVAGLRPSYVGDHAGPRPYGGWASQDDAAGEADAATECARGMTRAMAP